MFPLDLPELNTPRLTLRALRPSDAPAIFQYFSLDEVTEFYDLETFTCVQEAEHLLQTWQNRFLAQTSMRWGLTLKGEDERVIGTCGLHSFSLENSRAEMGYELHPEFWQQGLMSEAIIALLQYGFTVLDLHRLEAFIDPVNDASAALLSKVGLRAEGILRDYFYEKGRFVDAQMWSSLNPNHQDEIARLMSSLAGDRNANPVDKIRQMREGQLHACAIENRGKWLKEQGETWDTPES